MHTYLYHFMQRSNNLKGFYKYILVIYDTNCNYKFWTWNTKIDKIKKYLNEKTVKTFLLCITKLGKCFCQLLHFHYYYYFNFSLQNLRFSNCSNHNFFFFKKKERVIDLFGAGSEERANSELEGSVEIGLPPWSSSSYFSRSSSRSRSSTTSCFLHISQFKEKKKKKRRK